ncbi:MAG: reprolysin-like metallopeptidase [Thermodesulfobacteriota bacterium]
MMLNHSRSWNQWKLRVAAVIVFAGLFPLYGGAEATAQTAPMLWKPARWTGEAPLSPQTVRSLAVSVNVKQLTSTQNNRFSILLPDRESMVILKTREERVGARGFVWHGKVEKDALSSATFSVVENAVVGNIITSKGKFVRLRYGSEGIHFVEELDASKFPPEGEPIPRAEGPGVEDREPCATDGPGEIDVLVVYTQDARTGAGGADAMEATVYLAVAETNESYLNSSINQRLRLVHLAEVSYTESGNMTTDLINLRGTTDGNMDNVHTLRDTFGADALVLITENGGGSCGKAFIMTNVGNAFQDSAFAVVERSCATGYYSFGHELGHVMGARHDWTVDSTNNSPYAYNHGHTQPTPTTAGVSPWRTVMAYPDACTSVGVNCTRLQHWSNPNITWGGDAMGVATGGQQEDNRQTLNNTALTVANFRCSSPGRNDVWMKDTWSDTGAEPDPNQAALPMWQSPYIWIRQQQDASIIHQHEHQNPEFGQVNYIYVMLHNGGSTTSGNVEVYSANASTGLSWPSDWTLVSSAPVPTFDAHTTRIVEFPWSPSSTGHHCLVARWVSSSDPMTIPETTDMNANARGNNNLVWRNVNIVNLSIAEGYKASFIVRNTESQPKLISLALEAPKKERGESFLKFGKVTLRLDEQLLKAWAQSCYRGRGFKRKGKDLVITDPRGAILEGIALGPRFSAPIDIEFNRPAAGEFPRDRFYVNVVQNAHHRRRSQVMGGVTYAIQTDRLAK